MKLLEKGVSYQVPQNPMRNWYLFLWSYFPNFVRKMKIPVKPRRDILSIMPEEYSSNPNRRSRALTVVCIHQRLHRMAGSSMSIPVSTTTTHSTKIMHCELRGTKLEVPITNKADNHFLIAEWTGCFQLFNSLLWWYILPVEKSTPISGSRWSSLLKAQGPHIHSCPLLHF